MCGLIGMFDLRARREPDAVAISRGMQVMRRRGPDDEGSFAAPGVGLGHRRLAVIDPVGARQPWVDRQTGMVLVYNGEVYNFRELRRDLQAAGHPFTTSSDTEVLMRAYIEWGDSCLDRLSGIYAFAVYDPKQERLFLARDRLGVKPLFFSRRNQWLFFASSIPALLCFPDLKPVLDLPAVSHYLATTKTTMGNRSLLRQIACLQPGEQLVSVRGGSDAAPHRYWDIPILSAEEKRSVSVTEAAERVQERVNLAVGEQLVSDVPLGGFLSGGIDSAILAHAANRLTGGGFTAYSVGYDIPGYEEWSFVDLAAAACGIACRKIHLSADTYPDTWHDLIRFKGLPLSTPNEVPICHLAQALKQEFTVALSGEGSDEIFGGYVVPTFCAFDYDRARREPPRDGEPWSATDHALQRLYGRPYLMCRPDQHLLLNSWLPTDRKEALLTAAVWNALDGDDAVFSFYEDMFARFQSCTTFDAYMHVHARVNLESLLFRVDSSTMAASVEARVPFTDHRLVEMAFSLPDTHKMDWRDATRRGEAAGLNVTEIAAADMVESKRVLRRAFADVVPPEILKRPKMSFPVPFMEWFADGWQPLIRDLLHRTPLRGTLFRAAALDTLVDTARTQASALALWPIVNLCLWQEDIQAELP
ncbi:MAG: asparagine synthase (glutamine-hydrolyzing) [Lentisphaerae bacterium RIFOXYB12_FULL_65_16]|nr:MAG: asparagine synthase (glutamine-hydrolyzing) [Lentisphaerae bacterium RIFOXYA12_64_32]OGV88898.1 MAG: asparagine synthase (glutamine-hydrolyzing) [Lentisphaerae bacterium RIFOXYB12_FULL_65_16]